MYSSFEIVLCYVGLYPLTLCYVYPLTLTLADCVANGDCKLKISVTSNKEICEIFLSWKQLVI